MGVGGGVKLQIVGPVLKNVTLKGFAPHTGSSGALAAQSVNPPRSLSRSFSLSVSQPTDPPPPPVKHSRVGCRVASGHAELPLPPGNAIVDETQADVRQCGGAAV